MATLPLTATRRAAATSRFFVRQRAGLRPENRLLPTMVRAFLIIAALACASAALLFFSAASESRPMLFSGLAFSSLALGLALCWWAPPTKLRVISTALLILTVGAIAGSSVSLGWGLAAPGLPVLGLMVCAYCAAAGWRSGALLAAVSALAVLAVAWVCASSGIWGVTQHPAGLPSQPLLLGTHLITIAAGLACGWMLSTVVARYTQAARERERRFSSLLGLAADAHWELDERYRLVAASGPNADPRQLMPEGGLGKKPWELSRFLCEPEVLDELRADLDTRLPFSERPVGWVGRDGRERLYLISGEPRFDQRGIFTGYWGVARDITEAQSARAELLASETRYQELFSRTPTPLVVHREHAVLDANPAAVQMFGYSDLASMQGTHLLEAFESGDSRERARRRCEQLLSQPEGSALPVADFRLRIKGLQMAVRATGVRVHLQGQAAVLTIFVDDTDKLDAEEAVRRSESMLSHLVATSPDLITLTDRRTGRYVMVNQSFERLMGWPVQEALGQTSLQLKVWRNEAQRTAFVEQLGTQGRISDLPVEFVDRQGGIIPMLVSAALFVMDRREYVVINARDISERERLRLEREAILANVAIGIALTRERKFLLANAHFERIFGWPAGGLIGQPGRVVWPSDEEYQRTGKEFAARLADGLALDIDTIAQRLDGSTFVAHVRAMAIDPDRPADGGTVWIVEDVTDKREAEKALAQARDAAEAANLAKSAFLANTSHELRTPLNALIGLARLARDPETSELQRRDFLEQIGYSARSLSEVISDILDVSKIEAGKLLLDPVVFDLGELLQSAHTSFWATAQGRGLALRLDTGPDTMGAVLGDPMRVRQVLSNFLSNAIKFTDEGEVSLTVRRSSEQVRFEVRDNGPGIDERALASLFKPFTQADQSTTRRYGGTGLGLSISRELAHLMGGEVGVQSSVGHGSLFWAELPLPPREQLNPLPSADTHEGLRGLHVLMVEDNPVNMMIAVAMLERWGVKTEQALDGRQAVQAVAAAQAQAEPFDAVLMDVQMPVMSGHEATSMLRLSESGATLPIIALTAAALVSEREAALRAGMNDFLTKPIDAERLYDTLLHWCRRPIKEAPKEKSSEA